MVEEQTSETAPVAEEQAASPPDAFEAPEAQTQAEAAAESQVDYKAEYERLNAELKKTTNDLKAVTTGRTRARERDAILEAIRVDQAAMKKQQDALVRALRTGDSEGLPEEMGRIQSEAVQAQAKSVWDATYAEMYGELETLLMGPDGKPVLDKNTAPELAEARSLWTADFDRANPEEGKPKYGTEGLSRGLAKAAKVVTDLRMSQVDQRVAQQIEQAIKTTKKQTLEDAEATNLDIGAGASAGAGVATKDNIDALHLEGKVTDEQYRAFLRTGRIG